MQRDYSVDDRKWEWFFKRYSPHVIQSVYDSAARTLDRRELLPNATDVNEYFFEQMAIHGFGNFEIRGRPISFRQAEAIYRAIESSPQRKSVLFRKPFVHTPKYTDEQLEFMQMNPDIDPALLPYIDTTSKIFDSPELRAREYKK